MRLNRFLATAGLGSRRGVEQLIREGRVRVNGRVIEDLSTQVEPTDVVKVGSQVLSAEEPLYAVLNKPPGYMVTASDERDRRTIFELIPQEWPRSFYVGRLDKESEGLLILTNDGALSLALTHPRYKVEKEYEVSIDKPFNPAHREKMLRGFSIIGGRAKAESVEIMGAQRLRIVLLQGIKRQIRLMLYEFGYEVTTLCRIRIGSLYLGRLRPGEWRRLSPKEVTALREGSRAAAALKSTPPPRARRAPKTASRARPPRPGKSPGRPRD